MISFLIPVRTGLSYQISLAITVKAERSTTQVRERPQKLFRRDFTALQLSKVLPMRARSASHPNRRLASTNSSTLPSRAKLELTTQSKVFSACLRTSRCCFHLLRWRSVLSLLTSFTVLRTFLSPLSPSVCMATLMIKLPLLISENLMNSASKVLRSVRTPLSPLDSTMISSGALGLRPLSLVRNSSTRLRVPPTLSSILVHLT